VDDETLVRVVPLRLLRDDDMVGRPLDGNGAAPDMGGSRPARIVDDAVEVNEPICVCDNEPRDDDIVAGVA
jgi:hypothetical protein